MRLMQSNHVHPKPLLDRITQYGAAVVIIIMALAAVLQVLLAVFVVPSLIFLLTALFTALLIPFMLVLTTATPAVTVTPEGITVHPVIWKARSFGWDAVQAVKTYPLLPPPDGETSRKMLTGRSNYRPAEGLMLVIPALPVQYRITGLLAGEGFTPVIAVTTRTHDRYDVLAKKINIYFSEYEQ